jgi:hypothetical protein
MSRCLVRIHKLKRKETNVYTQMKAGLERDHSGRISESPSSIVTKYARKNSSQQWMTVRPGGRANDKLYSDDIEITAVHTTTPDVVLALLVPSGVRVKTMSL